MHSFVTLFTQISLFINPKFTQEMKKLILTTFLMISCLLVNAQVKQITGIVVDKSGEPVIGASIIEKDVTPTNGAITSIDGDFSLQVKEGAILTVSAIGYETLEVAVPETGTLTITLADDTELLEAVVVVGYGVQKKVNLTGAVASVKG